MFGMCCAQMTLVIYSSRIINFTAQMVKEESRGDTCGIKWYQTKTSNGVKLKPQIGPAVITTGNSICGKVIISQVRQEFCPQGGSASKHSFGQTSPQADTPPRMSAHPRALWHTVNQQVVRILL